MSSDARYLGCIRDLDDGRRDERITFRLTSEQKQVIQAAIDAGVAEDQTDAVLKGIELLGERELEGDR